MAEASKKELKKVVSEFRVTELQSLLVYANRNKNGRKSDLLRRAIELLDNGPNPAIVYKINMLSRHKHPDLTGASSRHSSSQSKSAEQSNIPPAPSPPAPMPLLVPQHLELPRTSSRVDLPVPQLLPSSVDFHQAFSTIPLTGTSMLHSEAPGPSTMHSASPYHPDVRFKHLPFYDVRRELLKPSCLSAVASSFASSSAMKNVQRAVFTFCLTPNQINEINQSKNELLSDDCGIVEYGTQVQLRFCLAETTCDQNDFFPPNIGVRVNYSEVQLPTLIPSNKQGVEPKRPGRPLNITSATTLTSTAQNTINVTWTQELNRNYCLAVYLVKQLTSVDLLNKLKHTGVRHSDHTRALIKEKMSQNADSEISTTSLRISLLCPLAKTRMVVPCRASSCQHLQCFDAASFLQMNEKKSSWMCPVCDKPAEYSSLIIDGLFTDILAKALDSNDIQFSADGHWSPLKPKGAKSKSCDDSVIIETIPDSPVPVKTVEVIDLTESDDENDVRPLSRASSFASSSSSGLIITSMPPSNHTSSSSTSSFDPDNFSHVAVDLSSRNTPPVLNHFMELEPWGTYFSKASHSATSSVPATSGDIHAVMRPRSASQIDTVSCNEPEGSSAAVASCDAMPAMSPSLSTVPCTSRRPSASSDGSAATVPLEATETENTGNLDELDIIALD